MSRKTTVSAFRIDFFDNFSFRLSISVWIKWIKGNFFIIKTPGTPHDPFWHHSHNRLHHIVKALNEAVDEVRKDEWRALDVDGRKAIKGLRWLLGMNAKNRTKANTRFLNELRHSNRRIHRAWVLKDEFDHFWNFSYKTSAVKFLKRWMTSALKSRIPSLRKFVGTLRRHFDHIIAFIHRPLTNAVSEGINRILKIVKNRASGFRALEKFADLIFLTIGDLDILDQIPCGLRTL